MAISSYKVELRKSTDGTAYTKFVDIKSFPDLFGDPNTIETTTLSDNMQTYIPGIKSSSMLQFVINWDNEIAKLIKALEGTIVKWEVGFSDGTKFRFEGSPSLGVPGKGVDEVLEANLNIVPSTTVTIAEE